MSLEFSDKKYFDKACQMNAHRDEAFTLTVEGAFIVLIKGVSFGQLDNLIKHLQDHYKNYNDEDIYNKLQMCGEASENSIDKKLVYQCAVDCISNGESLGTMLVPGRNTNASDWMSHCLWEGRLCAAIADKMGLDPVRAEVTGMLHDYGRKEIHTMQHVLRGFEMLCDMGYDKEAVGCLTHSFLNGGRCASNETAEEGFYVSEDGKPCWAEGAKKDEITRFLESYEYTDYDRILNIADLMAASYGILSPYDRIMDIATRRTIDETNRGYFLSELVGMISYMSKKMQLECFKEEYLNMRFGSEKTIEGMMDLLKSISNDFYPSIMELVSRKN